MSVQKIRGWYRKGERVRFTSHLDVLRAWERAIRRAGLPLSYSEGFTPHPRIAFAAPLPLGFTAEAEVMDVSLDERMPTKSFVDLLRTESTEDLRVFRAAEVPVTAPSPQASMRWALYRAELQNADSELTCTRVSNFLGVPRLVWEENRNGKTRSYDLRAVVTSMSVRSQVEPVEILMKLRSDPEVTGRPGEVIAALFPESPPEVQYVRTGIVLDEPSPARDAWRRTGRYL